MVTRVSGAYSARLVLVQAVLFIAAAIILTRTRPLGPRARCDPPCACCRSPRSRSPPRRSRRSSPTRSRGGAPTCRSPTFWWVLLGWVALITAVALVGPWRRNLLGPAGRGRRGDRRRARGRRLHRLHARHRLPDGRPPGPRRAVLRDEQPGVRAADGRRSAARRRDRRPAAAARPTGHRDRRRRRARAAARGRRRRPRPGQRLRRAARADPRVRDADHRRQRAEGQLEGRSRSSGWSASSWSAGSRCSTGCARPPTAPTWAGSSPPCSTAVCGTSSAARSPSTCAC